MLGLALEGGGAKGAFHMGAYKAFMEEGYEFDGIVGTSIGALNGAIIAQGDFDLGYKFWKTMDNSLLFDMEELQMQKIIDKKVDKETIMYLSSKIKSIFDNKGLDTSKIRSILNSMIEEEKLRNSKMDLGIVTVSVSGFKPLELYKEDIPYGKIVDYLMASANFPLFKIEPLDGKFYIDGAFYDNCPINLLIRKGYKEIIAVRTLGIGLTRKIEDENVKVTNIVPSENLGGTLNFDNSQIQTNLNMGYCDTMRILKKLYGISYYIRPEPENSVFMRTASIQEESIYKIGEAMSIPKMDPRRMLYEKIFPGLAGYLGLASTSSYQEIIIVLMELLAEDRNLNKYNILSFDEFLQAINKKTSNSSSNIRRTRIFPGLRGEPDFKRVGEELLKEFIRQKE